MGRKELELLLCPEIRPYEVGAEDGAGNIRAPGPRIRQSAAASECSNEDSARVTLDDAVKLAGQWLSKAPIALKPIMPELEKAVDARESVGKESVSFVTAVENQEVRGELIKAPASPEGTAGVSIEEHVVEEQDA